jgi:hypothetical protein
VHPSTAIRKDGQGLIPFRKGASEGGPKRPREDRDSQPAFLQNVSSSPPFPMRITNAFPYSSDRMLRMLGRRERRRKQNAERAEMRAKAMMMRAGWNDRFPPDDEGPA